MAGSLAPSAYIFRATGAASGMSVILGFLSSTLMVRSAREGASRTMQAQVAKFGLMVRDAASRLLTMRIESYCDWVFFFCAFFWVVFTAGAGTGLVSPGPRILAHGSLPAACAGIFAVASR